MLKTKNKMFWSLIAMHKKVKRPHEEEEEEKKHGIPRPSMRKAKSSWNRSEGDLVILDEGRFLQKIKTKESRVSWLLVTVPVDFF